MDSDTREYLKNLFTYMNIMNDINYMIIKLLNNNAKYGQEKNIHVIYCIVSEIIRVFPYSYNIKKDILYLKKDGILLLSDKLTYIENEYTKILNNSFLKKSLINIYSVRNKFTHEPHNLTFGYSVGGKSSYSAGIYYKNELKRLSTIDLQAVVKELNSIFKQIKDEFISKVNLYDKKYKEYPIYKKTIKFDFDRNMINSTIIANILNEEEKNG